MSKASQYRNIPKQEFEVVLRSISLVAEFTEPFYKFEWIEEDGKNVRIDTEIKEYCYFLPIDSEHEVCLKIYSGVKRDTNKSREKGEDAIRIVVAKAPHAEPVRGAMPIVKRIQTWKENFRIRISEALESIGINVICKCGARMYLWRNTKIKDRHVRFLSCSKKCGHTRRFEPRLADLKI